MCLILEVKFRGDLLDAFFYATLKAQKISVGALRVLHIIFEVWESAVKTFGPVLFSLTLDDRIESNFRKTTLEGVHLHNKLRSEILKNDFQKQPSKTLLKINCSWNFTKFTGRRSCCGLSPERFYHQITQSQRCLMQFFKISGTVHIYEHYRVHIFVFFRTQTASI